MHRSPQGRQQPEQQPRQQPGKQHPAQQQPKHQETTTLHLIPPNPLSQPAALLPNERQERAPSKPAHRHEKNPLPEGQTPGHAKRDPIAARRAANEALRNSPQFAADMAKAGVTGPQIASMRAKKAPLGFSGPDQYELFKSELNEAMGKAGLGDASVGLKGTSTTFYSENPGKPLGHHWDADLDNPGDYDLNIDSPTMVKQLQELGISPSEKYGIFKTRDVNENFPALDAFQSKWSDILGRDVNFVCYPKKPTRDLTEYIVRQS